MINCWMLSLLLLPSKREHSSFQQLFPTNSCLCALGPDARLLHALLQQLREPLADPNKNSRLLS